MSKLKIAVIAPFEESVPPTTYGGTEAVVYTLVEELHRQGHDVTLFASGDSKVSCRLVPITPKAIGSGHSKRLREALTYQALVKVAQALSSEQFDVIHNHLTSGWQTLMFKDAFRAPVVTTVHFMLTDKCEATMYSQYKDMPYVSISNAQRAPLPDLNYTTTIYHGLNLKPFTFQAKPGEYLAFLGRFSPDKGPDTAIEIAKRTGQKLIMAAKINNFERKYYEEKVKPLIDGDQIVYIGEVDLPGKVKLLRGAKALLNPVRLHESFGLTNIEAMAVGTPVIALSNGAIPEIIQDGTTGFICSSVDEMVAAIPKIDSIKRMACRERVERHFTAEIMTEQYLNVYRQLIAIHNSVPNPTFSLSNLLAKPMPGIATTSGV